MENNEKPRPAGFMRDTRRTGAGGERYSLRAKVADLDKDILRLLMKRHNLVAKMKQNGKLDIKDEKALRETWQKEAGRVSRDPELSGRFFAMMQQLVFLPRPVENEDGEQPASQRRAAFNLAPPRRPIHAAFTAPLANWATFAWMYMAACAGQPVELEPCLQNDLQVDFIKALVQMGAAVSRRETAIIARQAMPLGAPDRVLNVGGSEFGFYLLLAHYLGRPARAKFIGATNLKLADFSALKHFLPQMGARLITLVPKMEGLPARVEAAGILPPGVTVTAELSSLLAEALLLAAPFYAAPFCVDIGPHPARETILAHVLPVLKDVGATFELQKSTISIEPSELVIPGRPDLPLDAELASFLMAFADALGGEIRLSGKWPQWPEMWKIWEICKNAGWSQTDNGVAAALKAPITTFCGDSIEDAPEWNIPLQTAMAACAVLSGGKGKVAQQWLSNNDLLDFLRIAGLNVADDGTLAPGAPYAGGGWNAPSAAWALALAVAACARQGNAGWSLGNPAEVMELWPAFWTFYNSLPEPRLKRDEPIPEEKAQRRRIHTSVRAVLPQAKEE